jgi:hypothetical protein
MVLHKSSRRWSRATARSRDRCLTAEARERSVWLRVYLSGLLAAIYELYDCSIYCCRRENITTSPCLRLLFASTASTGYNEAEAASESVQMFQNYFGDLLSL